VSSDPVSSAAAQNVWLHKDLAAERRLGAGNGQAAGGPVLASAADREHAVEAIQDAYAEGSCQGRVRPRVGRALGARTIGELTAATARLPDPPTRPATDGTSPDCKGAVAWARFAWRLMRGR
jgi:uncharacterized protein DUF1707